MLNRCFALVLVGALLFQCLGYYAFYGYMLSDAKSEACEAIKSGEESLSIQKMDFAKTDFSARQLKELQKEKEFSLNGKMYDVVRYEDNADHLIIYVYSDSRESALNADLAQSVQSQNQKQSGTTRVSVKAAFDDSISITQQISATLFSKKTTNLHAQDLIPAAVYISLPCLPPEGLV